MTIGFPLASLILYDIFVGSISNLCSCARMSEIASTVEPVSGNKVMWAVLDPCWTVAKILEVLLFILWIPPSSVNMETIDPEDLI